MKMNHPTRLARSFRTLMLAALTIVGAGATQADNFFDNAITVTGTGGGVVDLSTASGSNLAGRYTWAIFALQGGVTITDPSYSGVPDVIGNIGVAQSGTLSMSNAAVTGTAYLRNGAVASVPPPATISGGTLSSQNAILNPAQANAYAAASAASGLASKYTDGAGNMSFSGSFSPGGMPTLVDGSFVDTGSINLNGSSAQINGAAGATYVLNLANLVLTANSTLTLTGDATTNYIINVSKFMSLSTGSDIVLSGGLQPQNVLFNVRNTYNYDVTLSGGSTVEGIILATNRNVKLTGASVVTGEVIARGVSLSGNSKVINPVASP